MLLTSETLKVFCFCFVPPGSQLSMPAPEEVEVAAPVWDVLEVAVVAIAHLVAVDPGMLQ